MSLVRLSRLFLAGSFAGSVLLVALGLVFIDRMLDAQGEFDDLLALQRDIGALSVATDTLMLFHASPAIEAAVRRDAADIAARLEAIARRHPDARSGIVAIDLMLERLDARTRPPAPAEADGTTATAGLGPLGLSLREQTLLAQMAAHGIALDTATTEAVAAMRREIFAEGLGGALSFATAAVVFAMTTALVFWLLNRRVAGPIQRLAATVRAIEAGDTTARAEAGSKNEIGELARAFNAMIDSLERTLEDLRRSQAVQRVAGAVARLGGWRWQIDADDVHWTDETAAILDEPPGTRPSLDAAFSYYGDGDRERLAKAFAGCVERGAPYDIMLKATTAAGRAIEVRAIGEPERDTDGRIVAVRGAFQDITERRALDARLHQAEKLETVGQLTGGVAHDFNNLLTIILGNAELLSESAPDAATRESAGIILDAADRGAELTANLLAFSRRQPLDPRPTDLHALIRDNERLLRRGIHEGIELVLKLGADAPIATIDPNKLQAALLNLVVNSRQAIGDDGTIVIETANATLDAAYAAQHDEVVAGDYVAVAVSDDGSGMAPDVVRQAFEPFFTTKHAGAGTGLGLSSVYGFAKQSRGHAKIYSELGQGTSVKLYLPRAEEAAASASRPAATDLRPGRGQHVLVVEDDPALRAHAAFQIERMAYRVSAAASAHEALAVLDRCDDIALLFTDVVMPGGMNGRALAEAAKARQPGLKILYTSGYTKNAIVHHGRLDEGIELLSKPYRQAELADRLARLIP